MFHLGSPAGSGDLHRGLRAPLTPAGADAPWGTAYSERSLDTSERSFGRPATRFDVGARRSDNGKVPQTPQPTPAHSGEGISQRQHIIDTALSLMAQRGVDGTGMRDLAAAAGLNVASLYHYFPSKRDLLVAVLAEHGFIDELTAPSQPALTRDPAAGLGAMLDDMLQSMLQVEDFIRLMLGEVMRGEETAHGVGVELVGAFQESLEHWLEDSEPDLCARSGGPAVARLLRSALIGLFFEHVAGVLDGGDDAASAFRARAFEVAEILLGHPPG